MDDERGLWTLLKLHGLLDLGAKAAVLPFWAAKPANDDVGGLFADRRADDAAPRFDHAGASGARAHNKLTGQAKAGSLKGDGIGGVKAEVCGVRVVSEVVKRAADQLLQGVDKVLPLFWGDDAVLKCFAHP